jgi:hypothetical protein
MDVCMVQVCWFVIGSCKRLIIDSEFVRKLESIVGVYIIDFREMMAGFG